METRAESISFTSDHPIVVTIFALLTDIDETINKNKNDLSSTYLQTISSISQLVTLIDNFLEAGHHLQDIHVDDIILTKASQIQTLKEAFQLLQDIDDNKYNKCIELLSLFDKVLIDKALIEIVDIEDILNLIIDLNSKLNKCAEISEQFEDLVSKDGCEHIYSTSQLIIIDDFVNLFMRSVQNYLKTFTRMNKQLPTSIPETLIELLGELEEESKSIDIKLLKELKSIFLERLKHTDKETALKAYDFIIALLLQLIYQNERNFSTIPEGLVMDQYDLNSLTESIWANTQSSQHSQSELTVILELCEALKKVNIQKAHTYEIVEITPSTMQSTEKGKLYLGLPDKPTNIEDQDYQSTVYGKPVQILPSVNEKTSAEPEGIFLRYTVQTPEEKIMHGTITQEELNKAHDINIALKEAAKKGHDADEPVDLSDINSVYELKEFLPDILRVTSTRGHTYNKFESTELSYNYRESTGEELKVEITDIQYKYDARQILKILIEYYNKFNDSWLFFSINPCKLVLQDLAKQFIPILKTYAHVGDFNAQVAALMHDYPCSQEEKENSNSLNAGKK